MKQSLKRESEESNGHGARSDGSPPAKRRAVESPEGGTDAPLVRQVADHYSLRENQTWDQRESSPIIHLKKLNNWVKSVLLKLFSKSGDYVLDLACGKGGDLTKWERQNIAFYVGVDVADGSVEDARMRYNAEANHGNRKRLTNFPARFICADCFGVSLRGALKGVAPMDLVSCQFAFHYCFETEARARQALKNVAEALRPGGHFIGTLPDANVIVQKLRHSPGLDFGNKVYSISFNPRYTDKRFPSTRPFGIKYDFHLEDAVDCPEWLVPFFFFQSLAREYGLELKMKANFHEFIQKHSSSQEFASLMRRIVGEEWDDKVSEDEWDAAYLYMVFVFKKTGVEKIVKRNKLSDPAIINKEDIIFLSS